MSRILSGSNMKGKGRLASPKIVLEIEPKIRLPGRELVDGSPAHNMPKVEDARDRSKYKFVENPGVMK